MLTSVVDANGGKVEGLVGNESGVAEMWIKNCQEGLHILAVYFWEALMSTLLIPEAE